MICLQCGDRIEDMKNIRLTQFNESVLNVVKLDFCSWDCIKKFIERKEAKP